MEYFQNIIKETKTNIDNLELKNSFFHITRLVSFILMFVFIIIANSINQFFILLSLVSLLAFILIVIKHNKHDNNLKQLKNKITVLKNYEYRMNNQYQSFANNGSKYLDESNYYLSDLDIFGDSSLFQLINVCETKMGQDKLAQRLKCTDNSFLSDVEAVCEFKDKKEFSIDFQANNYGYSTDSSKVSLESSLETLKEVPKINVVLDLILPVILLLITIVCFVLTIIKIDIGYVLLSLIINLSVGIIYSMLRKIQFNNIKEVVSSISPLTSNFELITNEEFKCETLIKIKDSIQDGNNFVVNLKKIEVLASLQDNLISTLCINSFIPFNIFVYLKYVSLHKKAYLNLENAISDYTNLESLLSLAIIPQIKKEVCIPTSNNNLEVNFKDIKHPLIKEEVCISNSLDVKSSVNIITGSNMSGKTSFLRTIGINLVLMYSGAMVNAKEFNADAINIYSSMRITDDIKNGISTFYRELLRIKSAIKDAHDNVKSIIFIDEVFRGTNSNDRIQGAISLINHLKLPNVILFMTTHDFELCKVEDVNNYHFEEHYTNDKIAFDYKLRDGKCTTTNAVYLMRLAGIMK